MHKPDSITIDWKRNVAESEEFPALGEGLDIRLSGRKLTGAALVADDQIIHLSALAIDN